MKYLAILPLMLITAVLWAQPIDGKRMKRDIEVAENIMAALIEDASTSTFQGFKVEGTYLESYGLLFSIQRKFGVLNFGANPAVIWDGNRAISGRVESSARAEAREARPERGSAYTIKADTIDILDKTEIRELAETFLADYGYLLTQLPNDEKICIKYSQGQKGNFFGSNVVAFSIDGSRVSEKATGFTMVIPKSAIEDHRTGKIDKKGLLSKIDYSEYEATNSEEDRELVLLNSIFNRLYQRDLSEGFFMRGNGNMERIEGLGVLFSYSFSSRGSQEGFFLNNGQFKYEYFFPDGDDKKDRVRGLARVDAVEDEDEDDEPEEEPDFDEFLEDFKSNIIEYGSTVRNLESDEVLSFELNFPSCDDCDDRPEMVKITAKKSILDRYRTGNLDLDAAIGQLQVTYRE